MSLIMPVCLLQGAYLECHLFKVAEYPGGYGICTGGVYARDRPRIDQPGVSALDVGLLIYMRSMAVPVAHQVVIAGACKSLSVVRHMGDEYPAPAKFQHGFLSVIGEQATGFFHRAVQSPDIADVIAVNRVDGNAKLERSAQGVDADQVAAMDDSLRSGSLGFGDGANQWI